MQRGTGFARANAPREQFPVLVPSPGLLKGVFEMHPQAVFVTVALVIAAIGFIGLLFDHK